ncbi:hypothetical protein AAZX31_10G190400 [Glycine max]|uniref:UMP kinase n=2 Tax=Glycine subgen. Soja TaxID=1462606 RepID=I1LCQ5_SOYBN|nr:uridylate kinase isoform X1 [Glycine max]XP_028183562.1 uncharacterized protein LOC114370413 isoform X1 [Glycine soja]KAG4983870.1 hypothetical protein JHK87_028619 [Glycine soja]KAG5004690.1 hypothetical protein JHK86_028829 [Glycine max]KAG5127874.1 hypothetical protein JHK82_028709 [Glycine max]KAG5152483.1 hypothetical protein JHK84_028955 [Glycine max]KAH1139166.1 hypothetical protein GYH30_028562 [Glycine max]|eukprot:XP_006589367.1 uncharacterized protein LOC100791426 isoform X1 [Glycine max]
MATEDYPLLDSPSHGQPHLHASTRHHFPSSSSSSPTTLPATAASGTATADYYPHPSFSDDSAKSNSKRASAAGSPYYHNKRLKSAADPDPATDYRKDREEWSDTAIAYLLEAYTEKFNQLNRGNLRGRDWEEVAEAVLERCGGEGKHQKSVEQCKNKIDNLKKRYKVELQRIGSGGIATSHWHWFKKIEAIVGNSLSVKTVSDDDKAGSSGGGANSPSMARQTKNRYAPSNATVATNLKPKPASNLKWHRVLFKISGSALAGNCQNIDPKVAMQIAREVATACRLGVEVAIVVGGRNFFCGDAWVSATGLDRPTAYQIGMMATVMNSILLQSALEKLGVQARVQSTFSMPEVAEPYSRQRAIRHLEKGRVVIFGGVGAGTGNPLFTTDTAAALRASELNADAVLKGTNVNGVFDCHPRNDNITLDHISFREVVSRGVTSMDMMALAYCEENGIPVVVFNVLEPGNVSRALCGDQVGTLIDQTGRVEH